MAKVHDTPSDVSAEDGEVHIDGPDGVAVSLTPEAAAQTSDRLLDGASQAQDQRLTDAGPKAEQKARRD